MADLYLTIKLNGFGWCPYGSKSNGDSEEKGYEDLAREIVKTISKDSRFVGVGKTVNIQIQGYNPPVRSVLVKERGQLLGDEEMIPV